MKKILFVFLAGQLLSGSLNTMAQNWVNGGNAFTANGTFGTTTNFAVVFRSNNIERARLTNSGSLGIGTGAPNARLHINSSVGQDPFRVDVNSATKLFVHNGGGVSVGSNSTPPANGLFVAGNTGIGTAQPENTLHVFKGSAGSVTGYFSAPLIVENSSHCYINILAPNASETGILFGKPADVISGGIIYNNSAGPNALQFRTNGNKTRMVLSDTGNLAIGKLNPGRYKLTVRHDGGGAGGINIENTNFMDIDHWEIFNGGDLLWFNRDKMVADMNGFSGAYMALSDERLKTNIRPMSKMMEKIMQLRPSTYQFKNSPDKQDYNGFIAQDVMKLFPAMVKNTTIPERNLDVYTMDYSQFGVLAIKGIQELQPVIEEQQRVNDEQKLQIATLQDKLAKLEAILAALTLNKGGNISDVITNSTLEQNQPNPFEKNTIIRYSIPQASKGQINIYDQTGKIIKTLNANGSGQAELNGTELTAGTYTYTLLINGKVALSKQMVIIK